MKIHLTVCEKNKLRNDLTLHDSAHVSLDQSLFLLHTLLFNISQVRYAY